MNKLLASTVFAIAGLATAVALPGAAIAQTGAVVAGTAPGKGGVAEVVKMTATITAIDKATRDVTLKGPQGNEVVLTAGPDVKNFDQMKVGDPVDVEYVEALTLELKKGGGMVVARTADGRRGRQGGRDTRRHHRPPSHHRCGRHRHRSGEAVGHAQGTAAYG